MRIAHLTTVDISLALLLKHEFIRGVAQGHDMFAISAPGAYVPEIEALGVTHIPVPGFVREWSLAQDLRASAEIFKTLRQLRLDVLHTHTPKAGVIGRLMGRAARVPVVVNTCHGLYATPNDSLFKRLAVYGVEGVAALASDAELYQNPDDCSTLRWFNRAKCSVVGNGVDLSSFTYSADERARVRHELGVSRHEVLVGGVGRLVAAKGVMEFLAAAERLGDRARFVWVGPRDDAKPDSLSVASEKVRFLGERRDMPAIYSALDIFVLPSYREGLPRSAMEAAACGRAIVLTDVRGSRGFGKPNDEIVYVPAADSSALASALQDLIDAPQRRSELGRAALELAQRKYNADEVVRLSHASYALIMKRKGYRPSA